MDLGIIWRYRVIIDENRAYFEVRNEKMYFAYIIKEEVRIDKISVIVYNVTQQTSEL